jgi:DNA-binding SARP family transcriptional activator
MLKVQLFGKGEASYNGRPLAGFPDNQCHRLLCYLLLNRERPHPRERLAALFWSEFPTSTSRTYLRNCLWRLRKALSDAGAGMDDHVRASDDSISFHRSGPYWLDVEDFEQATAACRDATGDQLTSEEARGLEDAAGLYAGDLLDGTYDDWCLYDRERLRLLHGSVLGKLLVYHEHAGTYEQGLDFGMKILSRDPTREQVHRQVMRLYWLLGNPREALAQYRLCVQLLREEMGVEPVPKTTALYEQMLHNQFDPALRPAPYHKGQPRRPARDPAERPGGEQLLERLNRLEAAIAETGAELRDMRRLVETALAGKG